MDVLDVLDMPPLGPEPFIDTHCHLDAPEFNPDRDAVVQRARAAGVPMLVLPAVEAAHFETVRDLAHRHGLAYALGIHPLYVHRAGPHDLDLLAQCLQRWQADPRLVAVGEIGLDHFVPGLDPALQARFYVAQLKLAARAGLPVLLHVRRSADGLLKGLRQVPVPGGIAHAFNGSAQQAAQMVARGFALGFGGALCFDRALNLRALARQVPPEALVLETDAPDIPPPWRYRVAADRAADRASSPQEVVPDAAGGQALAQSGHWRNEPAELPRIAQTLADLRGWRLAHTAAITSANARRVLPRLATVWPAPRGHVPQETPGG